jgi:hypothetical protein
LHFFFPFAIWNYISAAVLQHLLIKWETKINASIELPPAAMHTQDRHVGKFVKRTFDLQYTSMLESRHKSLVNGTELVWNKLWNNIDMNIICNLFSRLAFESFLLWEFNLQYRQYQMCRAKDINFLSKETLYKICNYTVNHVSCVHCCTFLNFLRVLRRLWRLLGDYECWMRESERGIDWRHVQVLSHTGKWENLKLHQLTDTLSGVETVALVEIKLFIGETP